VGIALAVAHTWIRTDRARLSPSSTKVRLVNQAPPTLGAFHTNTGRSRKTLLLYSEPVIGDDNRSTRWSTSTLDWLSDEHQRLPGSGFDWSRLTTTRKLINSSGTRRSTWVQRTRTIQVYRLFAIRWTPL